jgi:hypothetical protein
MKELVKKQQDAITLKLFNGYAKKDVLGTKVPQNMQQ